MGIARPSVKMTFLRIVLSFIRGIMAMLELQLLTVFCQELHTLKNKEHMLTWRDVLNRPSQHSLLPVRPELTGRLSELYQKFWTKSYPMTNLMSSGLGWLKYLLIWSDMEMLKQQTFSHSLQPWHRRFPLSCQKNPLMFIRRFWRISTRQTL